MRLSFALFALLAAGTHIPRQLHAETRPAAEPWPHPIPCRIQDGKNPDLLCLAFGDVRTPISDGIFDPTTDTVSLNSGAMITNYYHDTLGIKFYAPLDKTHFPLPPSGWCTWYYYYNQITADEVQRNADWIAANLKDYGASVVQIDDGWQGAGSKGSARDWDSINTNHFPRGMAAVASHIRNLGLVPGIWIAPHGQNSDDVVRAHPGVFLSKPDGFTASDTWEGRYLVDPSNPDSHAYMAQLFRRLCGWGYDYFKIDGQPIVVDEYAKTGAFMKIPATNANELYRRTINTIRTAIGPDRYLLGCWGIPLEGTGIMNGSRTGGDIVLGWGGFQVALWPTLQYYYLHNIVWYCDPDVLLVRSPLSLDQARVWATVVGLSGQALMSSDRLMDLSDDRVELLRRVYPATDVRPMDLFPTQRYKRIWDLKVNHLGRHYDVVGVFNFGVDKADQVSLSWNDLGLPHTTPVHVFDFWNKEYLGAWKEGYAVPTSPTSCRVLTLLPDDGQIQLISTSRHITQGPVDLVDFECHASSFRGHSRVVKNDPYQLDFVFPQGTNYEIVRAVASAGHGNPAVSVVNHQGWATMKITSPQTQTISWEVRFEPASFYHFPPSAPQGLAVSRATLAGVALKWQEQYYLNNGYLVYLDGKLAGGTPVAAFTLQGLNANSNYTAEVKSVGEDGRESKNSATINFSPGALVPARLSLKDQEQQDAGGLWHGYELDGLLTSGMLTVGGRYFADGFGLFADTRRQFKLNGLYQKFTASFGIDDQSDADATAEFIVTGDGRELWRSGLQKHGDPARPVDIAIPHVRDLVLQIETHDHRQRRIQGDWLEPYVLKSTE